MACTITDTVERLTSSGVVGLPNVGVVIRPASTPVFIGGHEVSESTFSAVTNGSGVWTWLAPWPSESDPGSGTPPIKWDIITPDQAIWQGSIPEGIGGPLTVKQLKDTYGWGLVTQAGIVPVAIQGPPGASAGAMPAVASGTVSSGDLLVEGGGGGKFKVAPLITYNGLPYATPGRRIRGVATSSATDGQALQVQLLGARAIVNVDSNFVGLTAPIGALVSPSNFSAGKAFPEQEVDGKFVPSFGCVGVLLTAKSAGQATMDVLLTKISTMPGASLDGQQTGAVTPWALDPEYGTTVMVQGAGNGALVVQLPDNSGAAYTGLSWYIFDADGTAGAGGSQTITIQSLGGTLDTALATAVINTARGGRRVVGFTDGNFTSGWRVLPQ